MSLHHDSALAARRIAAHPDGRLKKVYRTFWDLNFGALGRQRKAQARLDTLLLPATQFPYWVRRPLSHPTDLKLQEEVIQTLAEREDIDRAAYAVYRAVNRLRQGKINTALPLLREMPQWASPGCRLAASLSLGYSFPNAIIQRFLELSNIEAKVSPHRFICAGVYLIEKGGGDEVPRLMSHIEEAAIQSSETKKEAEVRAQVATNELKGYRAWKAGNRRRAAQLWSESKSPFWQWGAIWRGDLYRELGELEKAKGWYLAGWIHPVAHERLGRLYEEMSEPDKAAEAYERFIEAWAEADEPLQERVVAARERLKGLAGKGALAASLER